MEVTLKLYAWLADLLPANRQSNRVVVEVGEGETVAGLLARFRVPEADARIVLKNGCFVPPEARATTPLAPGDVVAVWPPVAGG
jgi:sulfur carrier protein ThiS